jgi:hypothetical protein
MSQSNISSDGASANDSTSTNSIRSVLVDHDLFDEVVAFAKANRPRALSAVECLDILLLQAYFRYKHKRHQRKVGKQRASKVKHDVSAMIAKMLRRKKALVQSVWRDFLRKQSLDVQVVPANRLAKPGVIADSWQVTKALQDFIHDRTMTRTRTVAKDVLQFFVQHNFLTVNKDDEKAEKNALRAVQRFLLRKGYKRGKRKGKMSYHLKDQIIVQRNNYVRRMIKEHESKERQIVYVDESFIHKNYARHDDSLYNPSDDDERSVFTAHKG